MSLSARMSNYFLLPLFALSLLFFNVYFPEFGFKSFAFIAFSIVLMGISLIPIRWGLVFVFFYIGLEGFLKVVSNYHPVIHVGADIMVILLCIKAVLESFNQGRSPLAENPPLALLFVLHFVWVTICLFNPYGLGLVPSLAGAKIYTSMVLLFFFGFYQTKSMRDAHLFMLPLLLVALLHLIFGIYQGMIGEQSVLSLHPRYAIQLAKYQNTAFRPFGLTNLPGGPAVYLAFVFPVLMYFIFTVRSHLLRWLMISAIPAGIFLFLLCQVRSSLLKMIIGSAVFLIATVWHISRQSRRMSIALITLTLVTAGTVYVLPQLISVSIRQNVDNEDAIDRSLSLFDLDRVSAARRGAMERFLKYSEEIPLGAGFARVGAAGGTFLEEQRRNPFFGENYFFSDNFWINCLVEIGLPGMILMTLILGGIFYSGLKVTRSNLEYRPQLLSYALFGALLAMLIGLYGAEGILYNPDASFFWFFSGVLLKLPYLDDSENTSS